MVESNDLSPTDAEKLWDEMDDKGYVGKMGSNKPEATRLVQAAHQRGRQRKERVPSLVIDQEGQPPLIPVTPFEQRQAAEAATTRRQRPDGTYRRGKGGIKSPIDNSAGMRGISKIGMQRANSKR